MSYRKPRERHSMSILPLLCGEHATPHPQRAEAMSYADHLAEEYAQAIRAEHQDTWTDDE